METIFTLSGRTTIDVLKSTLVSIREDYLINHDYMDIESQIEHLENIVDLQIILEKLKENKKQWKLTYLEYQI